MAKKTSPMVLAFAVTTMIVLFSASNMCVCEGEWEATWSTSAAEEAETVAAIPCSGHGRAYLDGLILNGHEPVCECHSCYGGSDCSMFLSNCSANAESGDPLFLEPFWMQHTTDSAILVSGWHRMSYKYSDGSYISELLVNHIQKVHDIVGNAVTKGKYIIFGVGASQLLNAAVYALALNSSVPPAKVVATAPNYQMYKSQTQLFNSRNYIYEGDTSSWKNTSDSTTRFIEFVTSPNNPDGKLNKEVLHGPNVKTIYDRVYYWPHFTAIPSPADEDLMVFSISKLTGHAGSRFGWAIIKDVAVYQKMLRYVEINTMGVSREAQLRVLKLLNVILKENGREIFQFAYRTMRNRWIRLKQIISKSKRFSLQKLSPQYCTFFKAIRDPSPGCEVGLWRSLAREHPGEVWGESLQNQGQRLHSAAFERVKWTVQMRLRIAVEDPTIASVSGKQLAPWIPWVLGERGNPLVLKCTTLVKYESNQRPDLKRGKVGLRSNDSEGVNVLE